MSDYTGTSDESAYLEFGSTSIKFYIVPSSSSSDDEGRDREHKIPWDLGYDVFEHQRISPRTISHCVATLERLQADFPHIPFRSVTAVGTAALREAQNAEILRRLLEDKLGLRIHIIEGGIEAFLLETGFRDLVDTYPTALFDLGGGSNELIEYLTPSSTRKTSVPVGAIRLHCLLRRTRDLFDYVREGRQLVEMRHREHFVEPLPVYRELVGTGGTVRAIARCVGSDSFGLDEVHDLMRREISGDVWHDVPRHRRPLLLPGLIAVEGIIATLGVEKVTHRSASVKRGLVSFTRMMPSLSHEAAVST